MVAVQRSHHLVYGAGFGYANVERQIRFDMTTRFRIGSISKQFTAAAILLLEQEGKLKTSDPIGRYLKDAPASWSNITLKNLLTHTSGIADFDFGMILNNSPHRPEELLRGVVAKPLEFRSGTKFEYANINYLLLGLVVEQASDEPYCRFLTDRIFGPLRLTQTGCDGKADAVSHRAHGYHPSSTGPVPFEDPDLGSLAGAGSLYSSADDLIRWTEALHDGKVLSTASLTAMTPFSGRLWVWAVYWWRGCGTRLQPHGGRGGVHLEFGLHSCDKDYGRCVIQPCRGRKSGVSRNIRLGHGTGAPGNGCRCHSALGRQTSARAGGDFEQLCRTLLLRRCPSSCGHNLDVPR